MAGDLTGPLRSLVRALFRMNRPTTDGIGRMSSVLYFLRSESEQLPLRCESGSGRPCRSVPGPVIDKTNRFESDATFRDLHTISIATQQRTNETIVRAARIYFIKIYSSIFIKNIINYQTFNRVTSEARTHGGIPAFSHRPVEPPNTRSTRHSPRTREMRPILPVRAGFASSLQPVFPSFHAHRDRPRPNQDSDRAGRIPMKFLSYGHVLSTLRRTCRGNDHRETAEREIRT